MKRWLKRLVVVVSLLLVCVGIGVGGLLWSSCGSGGVNDATRQIAKVVPVVEKVAAEATREPVACDPAFQSDQPRGCSIATLTCGSTIEGNNTGMKQRWSDQFYVSAFCTPYRHYYEEAGESVYRLEVPANILATVRLDSDCADLDVVAMSWPDTAGSCPGDEHVGRIRECEMDTHEGGGAIKVATVDKPQVFLLGVDGKQGAAGNFRLTVSCSTYR